MLRKASYWRVLEEWRWTEAGKEVGFRWLSLAHAGWFIQNARPGFLDLATFSVNGIGSKVFRQIPTQWSRKYTPSPPGTQRRRALLS